MSETNLSGRVSLKDLVLNSYSPEEISVITKMPLWQVKAKLRQMKIKAHLFRCDKEGPKAEKVGHSQRVKNGLNHPNGK